MKLQKVRKKGLPLALCANKVAIEASLCSQ